MSDHANIHRRKTSCHANRNLRIRPQCERRRHLQENFVKEAKLRIGLRLRPVARALAIATSLWLVLELVTRERPTGPWLQARYDVASQLCRVVLGPPLNRPSLIMTRNGAFLCTTIECSSSSSSWKARRRD